jgi:hypothetical protein
MKKWILLFLVCLGAWPAWVLVGYPLYEDLMQGPRLRESYRNAEECLYPWQNMRILQRVLRPGTKPEDGKWYTAVYYEQILPENQLYRKIALYDGRNPKLGTCMEKVDGKYGGTNNYDPQFPPVAMTIFEGDFVLQTTDDPKGGVPLEKLPLLFGPLDPIVTKK